MDLYKIVGPNGECLNGGSGDWPLPTATEPGEWRTVDGPIEACRNGLHVATAEQLSTWLRLDGRSVVYRVETDGELIDAGEKYVARSVRLLPRTNPVGSMPAMPDTSALRRKRDRAIRKAERTRTVAVPRKWQAYLSAIVGTTLPASHPAAQYANPAAAAAERAYQAAYSKAQHDYNAALDKVNAAHTAAMLRAVMPD